MKIYLNGRLINAADSLTLKEFLDVQFPAYQIVILNTVLNPDLNTVLKDNDRVSAFKKGELPDKTTLNELMFARQPREYTEKLSKAVVGIAGLGGLGSVVGENLVRAGVGKLVVADFDIVEPSNINRQRYFIEQIGMQKVDAFYENMKKVSPFTEVERHCIKLSPGNIGVFSECSVVAECFDSAENKAMLVMEVRKQFPEKVIVAVSGVAGFESEKTIKVNKLSDKIYIVGDGKSEVADGLGLVASRVGIAASIQSHLIIRILLGLEQ